MVGIRTWVSGVVLALAALVGGAGAAGAAEAANEDDKTLSPYFFVEGGDPKVDHLPLAATHVDVAVSGSVADVTVTQRYQNTGKRPLNARYVFPASTRAAVHGMKMIIGKQTIVAKIKEREQAHEEFDAAKRAGKSASLLEEQRPNVFTMSVANVMPNDVIDVTLEYTELLVPTSGTYELVYPTVVGPRYSNEPAGVAKSDRWVASPYLKEGQEPTSTLDISGTISSGIPIAQIACPSHQVTESWDNTGLVRFALTDDEKHGGNRDFILRYRLAGESIQTGLSLYESASSGEHFFQLVVEPPKRVKPEQVPSREYVFILDVSGSMTGFPLDTAKLVLRELASGLRAQDRFNVLLFSGASYLFAPRSMPATPENVHRALQIIDEQHGGGGTELLPALEQALKLSSEQNLSRTLVVVTDGYIAADKEAIRLVRTHLGEANVFSFGIGTDVNRYLVEGLAKAGLGEPFVVTSPSEAKSTGTRFRDYIAAPVLTNVRVTYDGFDVVGVEPSAVPDVFAERPVVVQGKYRGKPAGTVTVTGKSGTGTYTQRFEVTRAAPRVENRAIQYLWARSKIAALADFGFGEPGDAERKEITALGLRYNLLTPFTSFIAVAQVTRNPGTPATDVDQPLPLPAGVSASAVGGGMQSAAEPGLVAFSTVFTLVLAAILALRAREGRVST